MKRLAVLLLAFVALAGGTASAAGHVTLTVYAASSLTDALPKIDPAERYSFGGSNTLAAQITQGAPADIFASANLTLPEQLYAKGLVTRPYVLTHNTLVVIVPRANPARIHSITDLRKPDVRIVIAGPTVPVGAYTLRVLKAMRMTDMLDNVVSREADVRDVLAKVALGEADAGFVYATDARTVPKKVTVLRLPDWAKPNVAYGIAVVAASPHRAAATAYLKMLLAKRAQATLRSYGFLPRRTPG
ncbi:MAG TPA: molybdate ABC transporter substrate-binding protein [Gaiellaceae bacterium]|nr:molybdate ABC transporter substrate-binding protein [Gaiellaceae bacterium]